MIGRSCFAVWWLVGIAICTQAAGRDIKPARGHARPVGKLTAETLRAACRAGGDYLVRVLRPDNRFEYIYFPASERFSTADYNLLRHAGTAFSLAQLARATGEQRYAAAARRSIEWLAAQCRRGKSTDGPLAYTYYNGRAKVGGMALSVLALLEAHNLEATPDYRRRAQALGRGILASQGSGGVFGLYYMPGTDKRFHARRRESEYYPGEACFALVRLYEHTRDPRWLTGARHTALDLIGSRVQRRQRLHLYVPLHDHWFLYALDRLYRSEPNPRYVDRAMLIARDMVDTQITRADARYADELGAWPNSPAPTSAQVATHLEGLCAAHRLATLAGYPTGWLTPAIRGASRFLLRLQFGPENTSSLKAPERATGGFSRSVLRPDIRIDYVQHAVSGLLAAAEILEASQKRAKP
jgi:hypothetical protein